MNIAFKEWAVVCRALASGRQIVILRKGGIVEQGGVFRPDHPEFLLFPTYSHQSSDQVIPEARVPLEQLEKEMPEPGQIVFRHVASVTSVVPVRSVETTRALRVEHVWSDDVVEERFHRWKDHSLWAMIVRVSALTGPVVLEMKEAYTGCKSWVDLEEDVSVAGSTPVIHEQTYVERSTQLVRSMFS